MKTNNRGLNIYGSYTNRWKGEKPRMVNVPKTFDTITHIETTPEKDIRGGRTTYKEEKEMDRQMKWLARIVFGTLTLILILLILYYLIIELPYHNALGVDLIW